MSNSLSLCYKAAIDTRKPLSKPSQRERCIPTSATSKEDFSSLMYFISDINLLIKKLYEESDFDSTPSFTDILDRAPAKLRCSSEDIVSAYKLEETPRIITYSFNGHFDFWLSSTDHKLAILNDLKLEAQQLSRTLEGQHRNRETILDRYICDQPYREEAFGVMKALNLPYLCRFDHIPACS